MNGITRVTIVHHRECRCTVDGAAIYVRPPCVTTGVHLTRARMAQLLFQVTRGRADG